MDSIVALIDREKLNRSLKKTLIKMHTDLNPDTLRELLELSTYYKKHVMIQAETRLGQIEADSDLTADQKEELVGFLSDDVYIAEEIKKIGEELAIIGLYKTLELSIKKAANASGKFSKKKINGFYKIENLKEYFNDIDINIESISDFKNFEELRLLNNCLKHSGFVKQNLVEINPEIWVKGEQIKDSEAHFKRLLVPSINFLSRLGNELSLKI